MKGNQQPASISFRRGRPSLSAALQAKVWSLGDYAPASASDNEAHLFGYRLHVSLWSLGDSNP